MYEQQLCDQKKVAPNPEGYDPSRVAMGVLHRASMTERGAAHASEVPLSHAAASSHRREVAVWYERVKRYALYPLVASGSVCAHGRPSGSCASPPLARHDLAGPSADASGSVCARGR